MLEALQAAGHRLFVATSKPEMLAKEILAKFDLAGYFEQICGATLDGSRDSKASVIAYLLEQAGDVQNAVMVGDTAFDVIGAKEHGIPAVGVAWGYGLVAEMEQAGAMAIAENPEQLRKILENR